MMSTLTTPYTYEQFTSIRQYGIFAPMNFSPDGSEIAYTVNTSGQLNLWRQATEGGFPHQITTFSEKSVVGISWSPIGDNIAFIADSNGDELYQVFVIPPKGGIPHRISREDGAWHKLSPKGWSPDGKRLAFAANDRDPEVMDALVHDFSLAQTNRVYEGKEDIYLGGWSPNGKNLIVCEVLSGTNQNLILIDTDTGDKRLLTPHEGDVKYEPGPWVPDGSAIYVLSDLNREFVGLGCLDLATSEINWIDTPDWDVLFVDGSKDGKTLVWVVNEGGYCSLHGRDGSGAPLRFPSLPSGVIWNLVCSPDGSKIAVLLLTPTHCGEIYVIEVGTIRLVQLTDSMLGGIDEGQLQLPSLIKYPTFDGRMIPALLFRPSAEAFPLKLPLVISIHGGPEWQEFPEYTLSGLYQYWLSKGIGVLAPNIRGSTGYGKSYQKLIHHDWGGGDLGDIEAAAKFAQSLEWVDNTRLAIFGWSYGGFAVLSAVSRIPHYWAAAVDIAGPSNLATLVESGPPFWRKADELTIGNPVTEREFLMSRSPVSYVDQIVAPLLIVQGANDPRVPKAESDQVVERLRARGVLVRYDVYDDEGHFFNKRENEIKMLADVSAFLESNLLHL